MDSYSAQTPPPTSSSSHSSPAPSPSPSAGTPERVGLFAPRLLLLSAIFYHPAILIAYLLYLYGPGNVCVAGTLCGFGGYPGLLQALVILAGCALLWLALYALVYRAVAAPGGGAAADFLRDLSEYPLIAPLLRVYGFVLLVGLLLAVLARHLTIPALVVGGFGALVCFCCAGSQTKASPGSGGRV
ncbi:MAG TPA: hypothetical protein VF116_03905 [Ktedonobacterales bacterium]